MWLYDIRLPGFYLPDITDKIRVFADRPLIFYSRTLSRDDCKGLTAKVKDLNQAISDSIPLHYKPVARRQRRMEQEGHKQALPNKKRKLNDEGQSSVHLAYE